MSAEQFQHQFNPEQDTLIDVRTPAEFNDCHVESAINLPLDRITTDQLPQAKTTGRLFLICQTGKRAQMAAKKLAGDRTEPVIVVDGGTPSCRALGMPVHVGKAHVSIERQVRIVAGSLVVLGVVLSAWVHTGFIALSGFVGAGLVFAGVTDTCAMGKLLMKMPWNR